ncbi:MAG: hypothetical protein CSA05_01675 [Bacteroidia bacterium]|nr:MAG: hypothetical protein CSA05_01675 [Bacteroidia bacterium]
MKEREIPHILIVDDHYESIVLLENMLLSEYNVKTLDSGKKALAYIRENLPDLVLLDIMMPDIDGFEVCKHLKENPKTENIPIIFITAMNDLGYKVAGFNSGGVDYVTKPFEREEILHRLKVHLTFSEQKQSLDTSKRKFADANTQLQLTKKELENVKAELQKQKGNSGKADSNKSKLVASVGNEILTTINTIIQQSNFVNVEECSPDTAQNIASIRTAAKKLRKIVNDMIPNILL